MSKTNPFKELADELAAVKLAEEGMTVEARLKSEFPHHDYKLGHRHGYLVAAGPKAFVPYPPPRKAIPGLTPYLTGVRTGVLHARKRKASKIL